MLAIGKVSAQKCFFLLALLLGFSHFQLVDAERDPRYEGGRLDQPALKIRWVPIPLNFSGGDDAVDDGEDDAEDDADQTMRRWCSNEIERWSEASGPRPQWSPPSVGRQESRQILVASIWDHPV